MVNPTKQFASQLTYSDTIWSVLPEGIRERIDDSIEGVTRSLLSTIPPELVELAYAEGNNHRPVLFGGNVIMALIYMRATHISESFFLDHIHSDAAMQYALNTENEMSQPFSANTFSRLRRSLDNVYATTGRDILEEITDMMNFAMEEEVIGSLPFNEVLDRVYRIDSLNISMHGRHMSRLELVYVVNRMNVNNISALKGADMVPEALQHYLDKQDHNRVIYFKGTLSELEKDVAKRGISIEEIEAELKAAASPVSSEEAAPVNQESSDTTAETDATAATEASEEQSPKTTGEFNRKKRCALLARLRLAETLDEALVIQNLVTSLGLDDLKEYRLLSRVISEQTKKNEQGNIIPRENSEIAGTSLQNPYDDFDGGPTCRTKDGKTSQGWSANVVQRFNREGYGIIVGRDLEPNTHSDQAFALDFYRDFGIKDFNPETGRWNGVCCDGLYCNSHELRGIASSYGFKIFCGTLSGNLPDPILGDFNIDFENMTVKSCPMGFDVKNVVTHQEKEEFRIRMPVGTCSGCKNRDKCGANVLKNKEGSILLKLKFYNEATTMHDLGDPAYREMVNKRNAVEGVPSVLRRAYHIDETTYFGKWYARYDLMLDTTAMNMRVLLRYRQEQRKKARKEAASQENAA